MPGALLSGQCKCLLHLGLAELSFGWEHAPAGRQRRCAGNRKQRSKHQEKEHSCPSAVCAKWDPFRVEGVETFQVEQFLKSLRNKKGGNYSSPTLWAKANKQAWFTQVAAQGGNTREHNQMHNLKSKALSRKGSGRGSGWRPMTSEGLVTRQPATPQPRVITQISASRTMSRAPHGKPVSR